MTEEYSDELDQSAGNACLISHDQVADMLHRVLHEEMRAQNMTVDELADASGVPARMIRAFRENQIHDRRPPHACYVLSLLTVLGVRAMNSIVGLAGYSAVRNDGRTIGEIADEISNLIAPFASAGRRG